MKILERERLCIELLGKLPKRLVLVGGYATSSFDFPRFSVDLDLVIREKDVQRFKELLEKEYFKLTLEFGDFITFYKGRIMRFEKRVDDLPMSVDLLVDMIQARQTGAAYSFNYLWKNSELRRVFGSAVKDSVEARVANKEMLIALKINSMRMADQRDIIALCNGEVEVTKVVSHMKRAPRDRILSQIDTILATLEKPESKDSIKGVFGIPDKAYERMIVKTRREVLAIRDGISGEETIKRRRKK